jgi:hypothetical protein
VSGADSGEEVKVVYRIENTIRRLNELGAPKLLLKLAAGTRAPGVLEFEFQVPRTFYLAADEQRMPFMDRLVPLWETNGDSITAYVDNEKPLVIRYYYEDPPEQFEVVAHSIMEAIEHKLVWLLGECGADPADVLAAAKACDYPSPESFIRNLK